MKSITRTLDSIVHYYNVGLFPNTMAACLLMANMPHISEQLSQGNIAGAVSHLFAPGLNAFVGLFKYWEYESVRDALDEHGWDERLVKPKMYSWCQRHLVRIAADELGYSSKYDSFARKEGHRWYHFLPKVHRFSELKS